MGQIFVAFSEYLNFNEFKNPQAQLKKKKTDLNNLSGVKK